MDPRFTALLASQPVYRERKMALLKEGVKSSSFLLFESFFP